MKFKRKKINIGKVSTMSIVINSIEVVLLIGLLIVDTFDLEPDERAASLRNGSTGDAHL